jgi:lysophospholipase L1-like esterase
MGRKNTEKSGSNNTAKQICFVIIVLVFFLLFFEIVLRVSYPAYSNYNTEMWRYAKELKVLSEPNIGHEHQPQSSAQLYGVEIKTNKEGWRDYDYPLQKNNNTKRIMMLGDSLTFGWGVPFEQTMAKRLEKKFINGGHEQTVEVINTGVGNYNTAMEVNAFFKKGKKYNPDMILLMYYINDAEPTYTQPGKTRILLNQLYLYGFLSDKIINTQIHLSRDKQFENFYGNLYKQGATGRQEVEKAINKLAMYCKENNIQLHIFVIPEMHEFENYPFQEVTDFVQSTATENDVPATDLLPYFQIVTSSKKNSESISPSDLWVSVEDAHPNAKGNLIIAEAIYQNIVSMKE